MLHVEDFVQEALRAAGASTVDVNGEVFRVEEGGTLDGFTGLFSFSRNVAKLFGVQWLAPGEPSFERLLSWSKGQGLTAQATVDVALRGPVPGSERLPFGKYVRKTESVNDVEADIAIAYHFLVTLHGEVEEQQLVTVVVSVKDFAIHRTLASTLMDYVKEAATPFAIESDAARKAFATALADVERACTETFRGFLERMNLRHDEELRHIDDLSSLQGSELDEALQGELEELHRKELALREKELHARNDATRERYQEDIRSIDSRRTELKGRAQARREEIEAQRVARRGEVSDRWEPRASVSLISALALTIPGVRIRMELRNRTASRAAEVRWVPTRDDIGGVRCEQCGQADATALDLGGHLVCRECSSVCPGCLEPCCALCAEEVACRCSVCRENVCLQCAVRCKCCDRNTCPKHAQCCAACNSTACYFCADECDRCRNVTCHSCLETCGRCQSRVCPSHVLTCSICDVAFCDQHASQCPGCLRSVCALHIASCQDCQMGYCRGCMQTSGKCRTCDALKEAVPDDMLAHLARCGVSGRGTWAVGTNESVTVVRVTSALKTSFFVVKDDVIVHRHVIGVWSRISRRLLS